MALFNFGKKKEENLSCCCGSKDTSVTANSQITNTDGLNVKILGSGCAKCNQLEAVTKAALEQLGIEAVIDHVTDFGEIAAFGVMVTPALVLNGKVVACGKILDTKEVKELLQKARG